MAPTTAGDTEGEFAQVGNALAKCGGMTSLSTVSNRHIVKRNKYFDSESWKSMTGEERKRKWKWARNSKEAKQIQQMQKDFLDKVEKMKTLSLKEKEAKKQQTASKVQDLIQTCKLHGGPIGINLTPSKNFTT